MSILAISDGKLYAIAQVLLGCANDIVAINAIEYGNSDSEAIDLMVNGFKRPSIIDICNYIEITKEGFCYDWTVFDNSLTSHGFLSMDRFIDLKGEDMGIRICMTYDMSDDSVKFTAATNDECSGDDATYILTEADKADVNKCVAAFSYEFNNLCNAADITVVFEKSVTFT